MPTSAAADRVAAALGIRLLRDADRLEVLRHPARRRPVTLCGEESFGTGSNHVREKDGLWAVLFWLNILAVRGERADIVRAHWRVSAATSIRATTTRALDAPPPRPDGHRCAALPGLTGRRLGALTVSAATTSPTPTRWTARSPTHQGIRVVFADGSRIVYRLSGTGTEGATCASTSSASRPIRRAMR